MSDIISLSGDEEEEIKNKLNETFNDKLLSLEKKYNDRLPLVKNMMSDLYDVINIVTAIKDEYLNTRFKNHSYNNPNFTFKKINSERPSQRKPTRSTSVDRTSRREPVKKNFYLPKVSIDIEKNRKATQRSLSRESSFTKMPAREKKRNMSISSLRNLKKVQIYINSKAFDEFLKDEKNEKIFVSLLLFFKCKKYPFRNVNEMHRSLFLKRCLIQVRDRMLRFEEEGAITSVLDKEIFTHKQNRILSYINELNLKK